MPDEELKETKLGKLTLVWFPEEILAVQHELVANHQDLVGKVADVYPPTIENQLAKLAAELDVILDGDYDIRELCKMLLGRLKNRSSGKAILIPNGG